jgi:ACS family hexuronate transporter-like MFS transporter
VLYSTRVETVDTSPRLARGWRMWTASSVMMLCSWLSYVDRQMLAVLSPTILADTGMSVEKYTQVVAAFSWAYCIANPLWGSLLDYMGLRAGMLIAVGVWSIASGSHAFMGGFLGFACARALLGLGEGATFPGGFRAATDSLPPDRQARGLALSYSGGSLGAIVTPLMVVPIALAFGWRMAFLLTAALGAAWLLIWVFTSRPPYLPAPARKPSKMAFPNVFERRFWALVSAYAIGAFALGPILYLAPIYLEKALGLTQAELGRILWIPPLGWEIGYFFWGWISDRFAASNPARVFIVLAVLSLPLAAVTLVGSLAAVMALFFWATFVTAGYIVLGLRSAVRAYPPGQTSMIAGIGAGTWSALVALIIPVLGKWFDRQWYTMTFVVVSLMPVLGTLFWFLITRGRIEAQPDLR